MKRLFSRRSLTIARRATFGMSLNEWSSASRFVENRIFPKPSLARGVARLHSSFRGRFSSLGRASLTRGIAQAHHPFFGNQFVKIMSAVSHRPTVRLTAGGLRGRLARGLRRIF